VLWLSKNMAKLLDMSHST